MSLLLEIFKIKAPTIAQSFPGVKRNRSPVEEEEGEDEEDLGDSTYQTPSRFLYKEPVLVYMIMRQEIKDVYKIKFFLWV